MKLLLKFNLIFVVVFGVGMVLAWFLAHEFLREEAREQVLDQAKLMMQTTLSMRRYTATQIKPILEARNDPITYLQTQSSSPVSTLSFKHVPRYSNPCRGCPVFRSKLSSLIVAGLSGK